MSRHQLRLLGTAGQRFTRLVWTAGALVVTHPLEPLLPPHEPSSSVGFIGLGPLPSHLGHGHHLPEGHLGCLAASLWFRNSATVMTRLELNNITSGVRLYVKTGGHQPPPGTLQHSLNSLKPCWCAGCAGSPHFLPDLLTGAVVPYRH